MQPEFVQIVVLRLRYRPHFCLGGVPELVVDTISVNVDVVIGSAVR